MLDTSRYYQFPATTTRGPTKQTMQRNLPPYREEARQLVTPPGAHSGVPASQAYPMRRPRGTQRPHGCQLSLYNPDEALSMQGSLRTDIQYTHTLTVGVVVVQYIAVLPISRNDLGGPAGADHYLWEPPRDSPVPPQGATNRKWTLQCNSLLHALIRLPNVESNRDRTASYYPDRNWRLPESALDPRGLTSRVSRLPGMDIEGFTETRKGEPP
jgi:hypothetical protein